MSKLNKTQIKNKYLSKDEQNSIEELKSAINETRVTITCMGLYNHGKSSILNTLIDDFEYKTFKTADVRETSKNKRVKYKDIIFVDTPGLNAKDYDDKRVMDAVKESDINLFVHNVSTGEFTKKEIEFLLNIKKHWRNPKEFIERTIFILSRVDGVDDNDIILTQKKMQEQIKEIFSYNSMFVAVSAKRYTKGKLENKKLLVEKSNIDSLKKGLNILKNSIKKSIKKTKKERLQNLYNNYIVRLNAKVQIQALEISQMKREKKKIDTAFNLDINNIKTTLSNMYSRLEEV